MFFQVRIEKSDSLVYINVIIIKYWYSIAVTV